MFFEITHKTTYTYSRPVFLEPHHLRVRPRCDGVQNLTYFDSKIEPRPSGSTDGIDLDGNIVENVWFQDLTEKLVVLKPLVSDDLPLPRKISTNLV